MNAPLTVGSLFAGIGGFDLGLERAGMRTLWQCEQDPYCQRVLGKHWPDVPCYPDVRALVADTGRGRVQPDRDLRRLDETQRSARGATRPQGLPAAASGGGQELALPVPVPYVDVLCGGFPCQDISVAGKGAGIDGARSGLWGEYARLIRELRPRYVIVENVSALLARGMGRVLGDLAAVGYDAEWDCIPASAVGAPHRRDRVWIVAYPDADSGRLEVSRQRDSDPSRPGFQAPRRDHADRLHPSMADADRTGLEVGEGVRGDPCAQRAATERGGRAGELADAEGQRRTTLGTRRPLETGTDDDLAAGGGHWLAEPRVGRVANGIPHRVDRLRALGNALVPQIAEWIGRRIVEAESMRVAA